MTYEPATSRQEYVVEVLPRRMVKPVPTRFILRVDADKLTVYLGETVILFGTLSFRGLMRGLPVPFMHIRGYYDEKEIEGVARTDIFGLYSFEWTPEETGAFTVYTDASTPLLGKKITRSNNIFISCEV